MSEHEPVSRRSLADMTRRRFLGAGSAGLAAVGLAGALPSLVGVAEEAAPAESAAPEVAADTSGLVAPLTAHVSDLATGELSIFVEDRTLVLRDPALALRLLQAGRG